MVVMVAAVWVIVVLALAAAAAAAAVAAVAVVGAMLNPMSTAWALEISLYRRVKTHLHTTHSPYPLL